MILSHKHKFAILNPPKTGSGYREKVFSKYADYMVDKTPGWNRHSRLSVALKKLRGKSNDYFIAAFVRNPWTRIVSWWNMNVNHMINNGEIEFAEQALTEEMFLDHVKKIKMGQDCWWKHENHTVDFVGSLENMDKDIEFIGDKLNLDLDKHENEIRLRSFHDDISLLWNQEGIDVIAEREKETIDLKGYDFPY